MKQIISKNGVIKCQTTVPYSEEVIKQMKKAGYRVRNTEDKKNDGHGKNPA